MTISGFHDLEEAGENDRPLLCETVLSGKKPHRFPGLDGLRALAALGVIVHHIEQARFIYGLPNLWEMQAVIRLGGLCVSFFFVLSGFLITSLLIEEKKINNCIAILRFYARRVLRIWPLYFFICFLGFFIIPIFADYTLPGSTSIQDHFGPKLFLYLIFAPHVESAIYPPVLYAGVLWSVGVEEWFYFVWPWIIVVFYKKLPMILLHIVATLNILRIGVGLIVIKALFPPEVSQHLFVPLLGFLGQLRFDCMAIGALGAYYLYCLRDRRSLVGIVLFSKPMQVAVFSYLAYCLLSGKSFGYLDEIDYSFMFLWVIINTGSNLGAIIKFEGRILRWLGKISYGLYCFNWIAIVSAILVLRRLFSSVDVFVGHIYLYGLALTFTILFAQLSYLLLERPFLRMKHYVSPVSP
jgi:peptidoglycan/LPS O-acetylase OafA/YrhL